MKTTIDVPEYTEARGIQLDWDEGFEITVRIVNKEVIVTANPEGLRSLARHLLLLSQVEVPPGHHIHLDDATALEDGSVAFVIERA